MKHDNLILRSDSYKFSHYYQYPLKTTQIFSYLESRGGRYSEVVFFGLQHLLKEYLSKPITKEHIDQAKELLTAHGVPFNQNGWNYILEEYNGYLPIKIRAVPEGSVVPVNNVLMTVENTDPKLPWLTSFVETLLLKVWYGTTVATQSYNSKKIIRSCMEKTCDNLDGLPFKLHDFGYRGVSSEESAGIGALAHLINFMGTDTVAGLIAAQEYYHAKGAVGFSIPAMEHSTVTSWGREQEDKSFQNMLVNSPGPIVACVSDSYDIFNAVENIWCGSLLKAVQEMGKIVVIRPDSGDPVEVLTKLCKIVDDKAGSTYNTKSYKVFNNFRFIWGDGINEETIRKILFSMTNLGYSAENFAFGQGGALLQQIDRDTQRFAYKTSYAVVDGVGIDVFKDPVTDKMKRSKKGKLDLVYLNGKYQTVSGTDNFGSVMQTVFEDGKILKEYTFQEIRDRVNNTLK